MLRNIIATLTLALCGCTSLPPEAAKDNFRSPQFSPPPVTSKILLLPLPASAKVLNPGDSLLESHIKRQLEANGYQIESVQFSSYVNFLQYRLKYEYSILGILGTTQDKSWQEKFQTQTLEKLAERLTSEHQAALMICARLVLREAKVDAMNVDWDGQRKNLKVKSTPDGPFRVSGKSTAISVELTAYQPDGTMAFKSYGGVSHPYTHHLTTHRVVQLPDIFADPSEMADGVRIALTPLAH